MKSDLDKLLLTAALAPPLKAKAAWEAWSGEVNPADAPHILSWAGGYIYRNLQILGVENQYLRGIFRHNFLANNFRIFQVKEVITTLTDKWEITPIKSYGMSIRDNSLGLRPIADFDFYVKSENSTDVFQFLKVNGFKPKLGIGLSEFKNRHFKRRGSWNFVSDEGCDLDLHWNLFDHLDSNANRRLFLDNSEIVRTKHGRFRLLTPELTSVLLVNHHLLNTSSHFSGLFDISRVSAQSNLGFSCSLAEAVGIRNEMQEVLEEIDQYSETKKARNFSLTKSRSKISNKGSLITKTTDHELTRLGFLYRVWSKAHRPKWLEKIVTEFLGGFVRVDLATPDKFQELNLGSGWHYQYPGDDHRWLNIGDSRFTYIHSSRGPFKISLKYEAHLFGLISHVDSLNLYANGKLIGVIDRTEAAPEFKYEVRRNEKVEFSIRSRGESSNKPANYNFNWRILSVPLLEIRIEST